MYHKDNSDNSDNSSLYSQLSDKVIIETDNYSEILNYYETDKPPGLVKLIPLPVTKMQLEILQKEWDQQFESSTQKNAPKEKIFFWEKMKKTIQITKKKSITESFYDLLTK